MVGERRLGLRVPRERAEEGLWLPKEASSATRPGGERGADRAAESRRQGGEAKGTEKGPRSAYVYYYDDGFGVFVRLAGCAPYTGIAVRSGPRTY